LKAKILSNDVKSLFRPILRRPLQVPLYTVLVVPFLLQIVAVGSLIGYLSLRTARKDVDEVATQLRDELSTRIHQHIALYMKTPQTVTQLNIDAFRLGRLSWQDSIGLERHLWYQMQLFQSLRPIAFGNAQGGIHAVDRLANGSLVIRVIDESTQGVYNTYATDSQGRRTKLLEANKTFDPRSRPWYKAAIKTGKLTWTEIYPYFSSPGLAISAAQPFYDSDNQLLGVTNATLSLAEISDFLRQLKIGRAGQTFIIDRSGNLVASSTGERLFTSHQTAQQEIRQRLPAIASTDILTRQTAQYLMAHFGNLTQIQTSQQLDFKIDGNRQLVQVTPFTDAQGLNWVIVVVFPKADLMEPIEANKRLTILLCLAALLLATVIGVITARWIAQPIRRLSSASQAIADGDLNQVIVVEGINELKELAHSYNRMATQLRDTFAALEQANEELELRVEQRTQQLEEAQKIAHVGSWELDAVTQKVTWSTEVFRIYGIDPQQPEPTYEQILQVHTHPDDKARVIEHVISAIQQGEAYQLDLRIIQASGSPKHVSVKGQPTFGADGRIVSLFGTILDISDRKQIEEQLRASLHDREILLKEIHHRVKNNLQMVSSLLRLQANSIQDPSILPFFKDSQNRVKAMALIHERLYQSNNLARIHFPEYVRKLVCDVFRSYNPASSTIRLYFDIAEVELDVDTVIPCGLIVNELVSNALKYAFPNQMDGEITISFLVLASTQYQLAVRDNGIGLPEEFDFRNTTSLGLQLVCALTQQLQGTIEVDTHQGTAFYVTFNDKMVIR
jgi:PAS domain S-box-containing protein